MQKKTILAILVLLLVIGGSVFWLGLYFIEQEESKQQFDTLKQLAGENLSEPENSEIETSRTEETEPTDIDIRAIQELNSDCVAWVHIPGTNLDYPVMQTDKENPDFYLKRDFEKNENRHGVPYLDYRCDIQIGSNLIIYGHHMDDESMFSSLHQYKDTEYLKDHPTIELYTIYGKRTYEIFSVLLPDGAVPDNNSFNLYNFTYIENDSHFNSVVNEIKSKSIHEIGVYPEYNQQFITLTTCEYSKDNGRLAVVGTRIS